MDSDVDIVLATTTDAEKIRKAMDDGFAADQGGAKNPVTLDDLWKSMGHKDEHDAKQTIRRLFAKGT
jgi:hypothetical protein